MKKTLTVNLNRKVFHIDEDAYLLLDNYLQNLRNYFRKEQGLEEIMADFEGRIEELLSEKTGNGVSVVSISEVENVIRQLGNPNDFGVESPKEEDNAPSSANSRQQTNNAPGKKKFYRDPYNALIRGVCSGIAAYLGWDVTWVRLATVLVFLLGTPLSGMLFLPGWIIILYIVLWIVVPAAKTAEQRLEMAGEPITVENIGRKVSEQATRTNTSNNSGCLYIFLKVCLIFSIIFIGLPLLFALAIVLIVLFAVLFGVSTGISTGLIPGLGDGFLVIQNPVMATIGGLLLVGIPLISLIYAVLSAVFKWKPLHKSIKLAALSVWIVSIFLVLLSDWRIDWQVIRHWEKDRTWIWDSKKMKGDENIITHTESFPEAVNELEIKGNFIIDLAIDSLSDGLSRLTIEGDSNIINKCLSFGQNGKKVILTSTLMSGISQSQRYKLTLQTSGLEKIHLLGAADLETSGLNVPEFSANISGASFLKLSNAHAANIEIICSGASSAILSGDVSKSVLKAFGASHVYANELASDTVYANSSGASKIKCHPVAFLDADASGASNITYDSDPASKTINAGGISRINKK